MLLPALGRAKESGKRISCLNNLKELGLSVKMYVDDNDGHFPPRSHPNRWPTHLLPYYRNLKIIYCPDDGQNPPALNVDTNAYPADAAPRSYIYNGWNDFYLPHYDYSSDWRSMAATNNYSIRENDIHQPADTVVMGEKDTDSSHWYFDYETYEDVTQLNQTRHSGTQHSKSFNKDDPNNAGVAGGSNYLMADASARFMRFGRTFSPINLWAVTPEWRNQFSPQ